MNRTFSIGIMAWRILSRVKICRLMSIHAISNQIKYFICSQRCTIEIVTFGQRGNLLRGSDSWLCLCFRYIRTRKSKNLPRKVASGSGRSRDLTRFCSYGQADVPIRTGSDLKIRMR